MDTFDPYRHGVFHRLVVDDRIISVAWNAAAEIGGHVGTCRVCGMAMQARPTTQENGVTWYTAGCSNGSCGREIASPDGRVLRRSSRHGDMPKGFWESRCQKDTKGKAGT